MIRPFCILTTSVVIVVVSVLVIVVVVVVVAAVVSLPGPIITQNSWTVKLSGQHNL